MENRGVSVFISKGVWILEKVNNKDVEHHRFNTKVHRVNIDAKNRTFKTLTCSWLLKLWWHETWTKEEKLTFTRKASPHRNTVVTLVIPSWEDGDSTPPPPPAVYHCLYKQSRKTADRTNLCRKTNQLKTTWVWCAKFVHYENTYETSALFIPVDIRKRYLLGIVCWSSRSWSCFTERNIDRQCFPTSPHSSSKNILRDLKCLREKGCLICQHQSGRLTMASKTGGK